MVSFGLAIYGFPSMANRHRGPNLARLRNPSDLDFDLSMSLKMKSDGVIGQGLTQLVCEIRCFE